MKFGSHSIKQINKMISLPKKEAIKFLNEISDKNFMAMDGNLLPVHYLDKFKPGECFVIYKGFEYCYEE